MKLSRYTKEVKLSNAESMLYNTLSRKYYIYTSDESENVKSIIQNCNKENYSLEEAAMLKELYEKGILIGGDIDELKKIEYLENSHRYQSDKYFLTVYTTNACNFRCTYCTQEHLVKELTNEAQDKILEVIEALSKKKRHLYVTWFGGEPLLQYKKIHGLMEQAIQICENNGCVLSSNIVTNGYLLTDEMLERFSNLHIESMQITIDGNPEVHDKRRVLVGGKGTYKQVIDNVNKALDHGIKILLRINVDEETFRYPIQVLDDVKQDYRGGVKVSIANLFQEDGKNSTYPIYKSAIEKGYVYGKRNNDYIGCTTCGNNSLVVDTNGDVLFCTTTEEGEHVIGKVMENGRVQYKNIEKHRQDITLSARENAECRNCIELPLCIGRCPLARMRKQEGCLGKQNDGLSLEERAKLDYFYDKQRGAIYEYEKRKL